MALLVSCGKNILTHNILQSDPISSFNPHQSNVNCVVWNHNNQVLASCGNDGAIHLSHSTKTQLLLSLQENQPLRPLLNIQFTSNSQFLGSACQDGIVRVWDLKKKSLMYQLKGHFSQVNSLSWNSLDSLLASCSNAGDILVHDVTTQIVVANLNLQAKTPGFKCVKFSPIRKNILISGSNDGTVSIWDTTQRENIANFLCQHQSKVTAVACSIFNENLICSSGIDQKVIFYDIGKKGIVQSLHCENPLTALSFHSDGHTIAVGTLYGQVLIYDLRQTSSPKKQLKGHENGCINYLEFSRQSEEERSLLSGMKIMNSQLSSANQSIISKDENIIPTQFQQEFQNKQPSNNKNGLSAIEEIKKEALQRLEQQKIEQL